LFFHTHFVPIGSQFGGDSTNSHTWFHSKFSKSSCMAFTQAGSDRAHPMSFGSKVATKVK
jgi:hypothetical protein